MIRVPFFMARKLIGVRRMKIMMLRLLMIWMMTLDNSCYHCENENQNTPPTAFAPSCSEALRGNLDKLWRR